MLALSLSLTKVHVSGRRKASLGGGMESGPVTLTASAVELVERTARLLWETKDMVSSGCGSEEGCC